MSRRDKCISGTRENCIRGTSVSGLGGDVSEGQVFGKDKCIRGTSALGGQVY